MLDIFYSLVHTFGRYSHDKDLYRHPRLLVLLVSAISRTYVSFHEFLYLIGEQWYDKWFWLEQKQFVRRSKFCLGGSVAVSRNQVLFARY